MQTALLLEDVKDEAHDPLGLLIGGELGIAVGAPDIPPGRMMQQVPAPGLLPHPFQQAPLHNREFRCVHPASQPYKQAIVIVRRILDAIGIGKEGPTDRTECEELMPVFIGTGQATHFQSENQPPMVQADLSQHALKAQARHHTWATLALIVVHNDHAVSRPSHGDGSFDQGLWPGCGLDVLGHLLGMGLTSIHHRLSP